ncbi:MAG: alpha/beta fold hydrolase [Spirochaetota bacterium]
MDSYNCAIAVGTDDEREAFVLAPRSQRAVVLLLHGMAEHKERYRDIASFLARSGFAVVCYDHAGHGVSLPEERRTGLLARDKGYEKVVDDVVSVREWIGREFPDVPCVLVGHSFGSFVARECMRRYGERFAAFVFCGTASHPGIAGSVGRVLAELAVRVFGPERRSRFFLALTTGGNNRTVDSPRTAYDWLSRDTDEVDAYVADPACGFVPCNAFFRDLATLLLRVTNPRYFASGLPDRPVLLLNGGHDPVAGMGTAGARVKTLLTDSGVTNVDTKVYDHARHELFHEINRREVFRDLVAWLRRNIPR